MKSRVVEYGACDLTCDHLQKAIVQEYVAEDGSVAIALRRVEVGFQNSADI